MKAAALKTLLSHFDHDEMWSLLIVKMLMHWLHLICSWSVWEPRQSIWYKIESCNRVYCRVDFFKRVKTYHPFLKMYFVCLYIKYYCGNIGVCWQSLVLQPQTLVLLSWNNNGTAHQLFFHVYFLFPRVSVCLSGFTETSGKFPRHKILEL